MESTQIKNMIAISQPKFFHIFCCVYVATVLVSLTQASRLIPVHLPYINKDIFITGSTLTIPLAFFIQNIVTEVYGYVKSRHLIQISLVIVCVSIFYEYLITFFPLVQASLSIQQGYNEVFKSIPRHIIAFILASFCGALINDYIISKTKIYLKGRYLRLRFMFATTIGEAVYMCFGVLVWIGYLDIWEILPLITVSYFYRLTFEGATLPLSKFFCSLLKRHEGIDVYDFNVNYNPFLIFSTSQERE